MILTHGMGFSGSLASGGFGAVYTYDIKEIHPTIGGKRTFEYDSSWRDDLLEEHRIQMQNQIITEVIVSFVCMQ